jgi:REP element-mobilizing transposase RayT
MIKPTERNKNEKVMPQSLAKVYLHITFGTKYRQPIIKPDVEKEFYKYLASICRANDSPSIAINGVSDHIHILCVLSRKITISKLVEELKKSSSKWIKTKGSNYKNFYWQNGYGVFSVSQSGVNAVNEYIQNQKEHHKKKSFQEEYLDALKKSEVEFDEKYLWD